MQERVLTYILLIQDIVFRTSLDATPAGLCQVASSRSLRDHAAKRACINRFKEEYLKLPEDQTLQKGFIAEFAEGLGVDIQDDLSSETWRYMFSDEIRTLSDSGISVHNCIHTDTTMLCITQIPFFRRRAHAETMLNG